MDDDDETKNEYKGDDIIDEARAYLYLLQNHDPSISQMELTFHSKFLKHPVKVTLEGADYQ